MLSVGNTRDDYQDYEINDYTFHCFFLLPNAGHQARREAGAQRTLYAVACMPLFGAGYVTNAAPPSGCSPYAGRFQPRAKLTGTSRQIPWAVASAPTSARCSA